jgi:hypothetical protein
LTDSCGVIHTRCMVSRSEESPADVISWMRRKAASLPPAMLGSLSHRRAPCNNPNCSACRSGEQHWAWVLYGQHDGRRFAVYVPEDLVPEVQRALENGRALQALLMEAGPRYVKAMKRLRASTSKRGRA